MGYLNTAVCILTIACIVYQSRNKGGRIAANYDSRVGKIKWVEHSSNKVELQCNLTGSDEESYVIIWYRHGSLITPDGNRTVISPGNNTLILNYLHIQDLGYYTCVALGPTLKMEPSAYIHVLQKPWLQVNHKLKKGDSLEIGCEVYGIYVEEVNWRRYNLKNATWIYGYQTHSSHSGDRRYSLLQIPSTTEEDDREYCFTCHAHTITGIVYSACVTPGDIPDVSTILVPKIIANFDVASRKTKWLAQNQKQLILQCNVTNTNQSYSITWYKNGSLIHGCGSASSCNDPLIISNPSDSDVGSYLCEANINSSVPVQTLMETIQVKQKPSVQIQAKNRFITLNGSHLHIDCEVYAIPSNSVQWMKGSESLTLVDPKLTNRTFIDNQHNKSVLSISDPTEEDVDYYTCRAESEAGLVSSTIFANMPDASLSVWHIVTAAVTLAAVALKLVSWNYC